MEAIRNLFAALFLASIGMLIHFKFLWNHVDILLAAVILVIIVKSIVITAVIKSFGYSIRTAFIVSTSPLVFPHEYLCIKWICSHSFILFFSYQGWPIISSDWRICFCASEPCFTSSSYRGELFSSHLNVYILAMYAWCVGLTKFCFVGENVSVITGNNCS